MTKTCKRIADEATAARVQVSDSNGQIIVSNPYNLSAGEQIIQVAVPGTAPGVYFLSVQTDKGQQTLRFIRS
jgi:hypothetical protein